MYENNSSKFFSNSFDIFYMLWTLRVCSAVALSFYMNALYIIHINDFLRQLHLRKTDLFIKLNT